MKISKHNAEHYKWGADCDGWVMVQRLQQSVIHELMPPGTQEVRHYHREATQFFFVLHGEAVMEIEGEEITLNAQEGIEVQRGLCHCIHNRSQLPVEFLVISNPTTKGDRVIESGGEAVS
ncbi:mannose-6-phosphate isomerase-like protein (cupin superfamily) [Paenibacillus phyllosphaerae]|uniref:Mannose-6-phosphate isomerase-like protein (Cupin superfamily) n=1 Tax=Paenibacillus phyllosphaerae TaxID=274593 RepID=A0A7W5AWB9_9BACL|nr:cupin domain-containing protein [Paenibacillus phyllosphaerae]MBB3109995.1 mannose-6-phosphate isomerase-like protein (cupin superfamily) [Paenibacillus phyllosphaerae]